METNTLAVQSIPLTKIRPNPNNPRHITQPQAVEIMAASMKAVGQETPIKVRRITEKPEIPTSQDAPTLRGPQDTEQSRSVAAAPRDDSNYKFELIGGHIRLEAAKNLGWENLNALILDVTPDQAELAALLDNQGEDMHWLDWYIAIEKRLSDPSDPKQRQVAEELGVTQATISRAKTVTSFLTPAAREAIYTVCIKSQGEFDLSEGAVRALTDLEDSQKAEKALQVVIDRQMTEAEAKKLVKWVQAGHEPESYGEKGVKTSPDDPNSGYWDALPDFVKVSLGKKGYEIRMTLPPSLAVTAAYGAMSNVEFVKGLAHQSEDMKFRQALPEVTKAAAKAWITESQNEAEQVRLAELAHREETQKREAVQESKAQARAQKTQEKEAAKAQRIQQAKQAQQERAEAIKAQAAANLENHKTVIRQKTENLFGAGPLTDGLVQKCHEGNKTEALKTAKVFLAQSGKKPEEQTAALEDFKKDLNEHGSLMKKAGFIQPKKKKEQAGEKALYGTEVASPSALRASGDKSSTTPLSGVALAKPDRNDSNNKSSGGLLDKLAKVVEEKTGLTKEDIKKGVESMLAKDAKQATNYEIRRGMRDILKKTFKF